MGIYSACGQGVFTPRFAKKGTADGGARGLLTASVRPQTSCIALLTLTPSVGQQADRSTQQHGRGLGFRRSGVVMGQNLRCTQIVSINRHFVDLAAHRQHGRAGCAEIAANIQGVPNAAESDGPALAPSATVLPSMYIRETPSALRVQTPLLYIAGYVHGRRITTIIEV